VSISSSQYAQYVRQVDLGYGSLPCSVEDIILYTEDLVGLLSSCLRQFPNLKALDFSGPPLTSLPHDKMKASIDPILMALCYVPLPNLTELEIQLPMTNDFAPLFAEKISILRIPIEQTLNRLHHLGLHVYAQTNQQSCATHLLRIVELSTSLTSLSLSSTNFLSIDSLRLSSKVCLRALSLHKVKISSRNLVNIIEQSIESMAYIELRHLQIEPGSPREILSAVDSLLCLCDLDICDGGAPTRTERFHLAQSLFFTAEHVQEPGLFSLVYDASQNPKQKAKSKRTMARDFSH
jgi:Leucine-rich repeat (LRR) protein